MNNLKHWPMAWLPGFPLLALTILVLTILAIGCPAPPPSTSKALSPNEFVRAIGTVAPVGMAKQDALRRLQDREMIFASEKFGDFRESPNTTNEVVHKSIQYLHIRREFLLADGSLQELDVAIVLKNGVVAQIISGEEVAAEIPNSGK